MSLDKDWMPPPAAEFGYIEPEQDMRPVWPIGSDNPHDPYRVDTASGAVGLCGWFGPCAQEGEDRYAPGIELYAAGCRCPGDPVAKAAYGHRIFGKAFVAGDAITPETGLPQALAGPVREEIARLVRAQVARWPSARPSKEAAARDETQADLYGESPELMGDAEIAEGLAGAVAEEEAAQEPGWFSRAMSATATASRYLSTYLFPKPVSELAAPLALPEPRRLLRDVRSLPSDRLQALLDRQILLQQLRNAPGNRRLLGRLAAQIQARHAELVHEELRLIGPEELDVWLPDAGAPGSRFPARAVRTEYMLLRHVASLDPLRLAFGLLEINLEWPGWWRLAQLPDGFGGQLVLALRDDAAEAQGAAQPRQWGRCSARVGQVFRDRLPDLVSAAREVLSAAGQDLPDDLQWVEPWLAEGECDPEMTFERLEELVDAALALHAITCAFRWACASAGP